jgi:hypothetical protein
MLGIEPSDGPAVAAASARLGSELLDLLRDRSAEVGAQPGVKEALHDGTFQRLLRA